MSRLSGPYQRLLLDALLLVLLLTALAFRALGAGQGSGFCRIVHEWTGLAFLAVLSLHLYWNRRWFASLFSGKWQLRRILGLLVNAGLCLCAALVLVCGLLNSRHILPLSHLVDGRLLREVHCLTAYWMLVFSGLHIGLHGRMILGLLLPRPLPAALAHGAAALLALFGLWAANLRDLWPKLFQGFSFDFWDPGKPLVLLFACNLGMMLLFAVVAHYLQRHLSH